MPKEKQRVVRMERNEQLKTGARVRSAVSLADLMQQVENEEAEIVARSMDTQQVTLLVDLAAEEDAKKKSLEKRVEAVKKVLKHHARLNKWKTHAGEKGTAVIRPSTSTSIKPTDMLRKLVALGKKQLFDTIFSVRITESKDYLGKAEVAEIAEELTDDFGSISLKLKKE